MRRVLFQSLLFIACTASATPVRGAGIVCGAEARHTTTGVKYKGWASGLEERVVSQQALKRALEACSSSNRGNDCAAMSDTVSCSPTLRQGPPSYRPPPPRYDPGGPGWTKGRHAMSISFAR